MLAVFNGGAGQHNTNVSEEELVVLAKVARITWRQHSQSKKSNRWQAFVAAGALYGVAVAMVKLSVLDFYTNMFRGKVFKIVTYTFTALVICHGIIVILATLLICRPLAKNWYPALEGSCGDTETLYLAIGIANLALDIAVVVLPMPLLWSLQVIWLLLWLTQTSWQFQDENF